MDKKKVKEMLDSIKTVKELINELNKEENSLIKETGTPDYNLDEVITEIVFEENKTEFKQFVLKSEARHGFIQGNELEEGKYLHKDLSELITNFLGKEYVNISFIQTDDRSRFYDEAEHFGLVFKKVFTKKKYGTVRSYNIDNCEKSAMAGKVLQIGNDKCEISVDQVKSKCLFYTGYSFANKNVLFFGFNVVENPFLVALFKEHKPAKILNIVPIGGNRSFFDNVD